MGDGKFDWTQGKAFVNREDYIGRKVEFRGAIAVIEDISVMLNWRPALDGEPGESALLFRLNGVLVPSDECRPIEEA